MWMLTSRGGSAIESRATSAYANLPDRATALFSRSCVKGLLIEITFAEHEAGHVRHAFRDEGDVTAIRIDAPDLAALIVGNVNPSGFVDGKAVDAAVSSPGQQ